jgi:hypothetical protein
MLVVAVAEVSRQVAQVAQAVVAVLALLQLLEPLIQAEVEAVQVPLDTQVEVTAALAS